MEKIGTSEKTLQCHEMEEQRYGGRVQPLRNLLVCSVGFMLIFTSFQSMVNLLSSISIGEGFGPPSLSVLFISLIFGALVLVSPVIRLLGLKWTFVLSALLFSPYTAANFYPSWYTFIPTSVIVGAAAATLWSSALVYVTNIAKMYAASERKDEKTVIFVFVGIFMTFFQSANIWGNFLSYEILKPSSATSANVTIDVISQHLCGVHFCDANAANLQSIEKPTGDKFYILTGLMTGISLLGTTILLVCLQPMHDHNPKGAETFSVRKVIWQCLLRFKMPYHILLVPITLYSGFEMAFWAGEFTKAYVACSCGVHEIGLVAIAFGVMNTLGSLGLGFLTRLVHRVFIITAICAISLGTVVALWLWEPSPGNILVFFIFAGIWGLCDSVFQAQTRALYGVLFQDNQEAAFAIHTGLGGIGQTISFSYSTFLCMAPKLYILGGLVIVSIVTYLAVEIDVVRKNKKLQGDMIIDDCQE